MRYLIIGLGIYGANLAIDLTKMGHEVIGADKDPSLVESIKDYISTAYIIDSTDEVSLSVLPLKNVDLVIVAIGENFGASIRTVALLKKIGVEHIYARAIDTLHQAILEGLQIDRIITPEQRAATDLVNEMSFGRSTTTLNIDDDNVVVRFPTPQQMVGLKLSDLNLQRDFKLKLIAILKTSKSTNILGFSHQRLKLIDNPDPDLILDKDDMLACFGRRDDFKKLL